MESVENKFSNQFYSLTPNHMLDAIELAGYKTTGRYYQLNSYENRVVDVEFESDNLENNRIIAKFYRPGRWSKEAILEEHQFLNELTQVGITAVAPLKLKGETLINFQNIFMGLFPKALGRMPQEFTQDELKQVGRLLARIHNVGTQSAFKHRLTLNVDAFGRDSLDILESWVAQEVWGRYEKAADEILDYLEDKLDPSTFIRIHGDCHKENILQTDPKNSAKEYFFVDFDDSCNGPPVQDFWMLFSAGEDDSAEEQDAILSGYEELRKFDEEDLDLMKPLRGLRIIHYAAWIARRWKDPSFPKLFPQYREYVYWAQETEALEKIVWSL